jgi:Centromere-associated protein K
LISAVRQFIQERLAQILYAESKGALPAEPESLSKRKRVDDDDENDEDHVKELAARMIALVEVFLILKFIWCKELMNRLASPNGGSPWVDIDEDDVVVRCLVRANVALMHPSDGSKIRMIEFHKEVESEGMED